MTTNDRQEHLEDLFDWAKRWQKQRIKNTIESRDSKTMFEHATVIQQVAKYNRELDDILSRLGVRPWQPPVWDGSLSGNMIVSPLGDKPQSSTNTGGA